MSAPHPADCVCPGWRLEEGAQRGEHAGPVRRGQPPRPPPRPPPVQAAPQLRGDAAVTEGQCSDEDEDIPHFFEHVPLVQTRFVAEREAVENAETDGVMTSQGGEMELGNVRDEVEGVRLEFKKTRKRLTHLEAKRYREVENEKKIMFSRAVEAWRAGNFPSQAKCAKHFNVNAGTLGKLIKSGKGYVGLSRHKSLVFSEEEELDMVKHVLDMAKIGHGYDTDTVRSLIQQTLNSFIKCDPTRADNVPEEWGASNYPSYNFTYNLIHRHSIVRRGTMELTANRAQISLQDVHRWFGHVVTILSTEELKLAIQRPSSVFNSVSFMFNNLYFMCDIYFIVRMKLVLRVTTMNTRRFWPGKATERFSTNTPMDPDFT